jgi:hypothetical protein
MIDEASIGEAEVNAFAENDVVENTEAEDHPGLYDAVHVFARLTAGRGIAI